MLYAWHYREKYSEIELSLVYVDDKMEEVVMFNYLVNNRCDVKIEMPVKLKELDHDKTYQIKEVNLFTRVRSWQASTKKYSSHFLMKIGFNPKVESY